MTQVELYRPIEILQRNPDIKPFWGVQHIGWLYKMGLISGRRLSKYNTCEVDESEVLTLFELAKNRLRLKKR